MFRKIDRNGATARQVTILVDGVEVSVEDGEPIAAILLRLHPFISRRTPVTGAQRAPYCMMGACFDCLVEIDGETSTRSCLTWARAGMVVRRQMARPDVMNGGRA